MTLNSQSNLDAPPTAEHLIKWLSSFGEKENGGVDRLLYSHAWSEAQQALKEEMEQHGLNTYFDSVGNLFGRLEGTDPSASCVLTGSHIDSVANGGRYDGVYGIIAGLLAVQRLYTLYGKPKRPIEVVSLCEEEGSRFPITFWGSGNITGRYTLKDGENLKDKNGISLFQAMKEAGFDPAHYQSPVRNDIHCFIEPHIEQGVVLERSGSSIGVVSHIVGQKRFTIEVKGESNHAGTTPMSYRKDSLAISAEIIHYLTSEVKETDPELVATVGKISPSPNIPNVIAGETSFTLDVRHYREEIIEEFCHKIQTYCHQCADRYDMTIHMSPWLEASPVEMDTELTSLSERVAKNHHIPYQSMISGAGHDAQVFGPFCPTSLLFVPSHKGLSHNPEEYTKPEDLDTGVELLTNILYESAYA